MRKRGDVLKGTKRGKEKTSQGRGEYQRKGKGEKERESGKGVDGDGVGDVEFGMIGRERSEDLDSVAVEFCHDDVVVLIDCHSMRAVKLTRT